MTQMTTADSLQVVSFSLVNNSNGKKEDYAIPIEQVREIRTIDEITKVPKAKSFVKGVMNLRGVIIPVVDIKDKLGFGITEILEKSKQRILVTEIDGTLCGILIDFVEQVMRIPQKDIGPVPSEAFEDYSYIKGIAKIQGRLIVILDVNTLLSDQKLKSATEKIQSQKEPKSELSQAKIEDDIPPELRAVFEEDNAGIKPTEITKDSKTSSDTKSEQSNNFQLRVDEESERIQNMS